MAILGTWTTIDCPTKKQEEALEYLEKEFGKINAVVRKVLNPHDFGPYPSFEIDLPFEFEDYDEDDATDEEIDRYEEFVDKANEIETNYSKKFEDYL